LIAEHWDTGQNVPETTANGNDILVDKDLSAIDAYWGLEYHQHNPNIPDGVAGVKAGLAAYFEQFLQLKVDPKRVIAAHPSHGRQTWPTAQVPPSPAR
jgi:predicted SnoaL-like aldol condensation-catalyzing enzyme